MVDFVVYFFICNLFISGMIGILLTAKKTFRTTLPSRMQYHLWFVLFVLLALPFIPIRIFNIFSLLKTLTGTHADYTNPATNEATYHYLTDTSKQVNDFAISVSHNAPSVVGYILCCLWFAGICMMIFLATRSLLHLHKIINSSLPLQNSEVRNLYCECLKETGINLEIPIYLLTVLTFLDFQGFVVCQTLIYVSFSLVFALMSRLQGKVFLIQF